MLRSNLGRCIPRTCKSNINNSSPRWLRTLSTHKYRHPLEISTRSITVLALAQSSYQTSTPHHRRQFSSTPSSHADKNSLPKPPKLYAFENPTDTQEAKGWIQRWKALDPEEDIPRSIVEVTFARSTGPGGQNVNKVATKASMRLSLDSNAWWIPQWSTPFLRSDPHYVASSNSLLITSHLTRSQAENLSDCFRKLHAIILDAASRPIKNEPTAEQKKRVEGLERAEKARRRQAKSYRSEVKKNRGSVSFD